MAITATTVRNLVIQIPSDVADAALAPLLDTARLIRTENLSGSGLSADRLDVIELYLAAHFVVLAHEMGGLTSSKKGESGETYKTIDNKLMAFQSTRFGQMALAIDTTGTLQTMLSSNRARFSVVRSIQPANPTLQGFGLNEV